MGNGQAGGGTPGAKDALAPRKGSRLAGKGYSALFEIVRPRALYRPDIDGLRAIAVLVVCAYHFSPDNFPGGFIGVDIFFVISGYLITGILAKAISEHKFSTFGQLLSDFYQRRIRRIFPALTVILIFSIVVGWFVLFASEYQHLAKHITGSAGFIENFLLWAEDDYFDRAAIYKPLLHLWSLAVEEQFYIFWPLVLWFVMRHRWPIMTAIGLIAGISFLLNITLVLHGQTTHAFYFPAARTWELMIGACLAVAHRRQLLFIRYWQPLQAWTGMGLILLGLIFITPGKAFPGFWATLPVLGTALLINAGPAGVLNGRILSWRPAVAIGLVSYTLYLWHWVLLSLTVTVFGTGTVAFRHGYKLVLPLVSLLLAWLTYRYFEQPVRRSRKFTTSIALFASVMMLGLGGLLVYFLGGLKDRPLSFVSSAAEQYVQTMRIAPDAPANCFNPQKAHSAIYGADAYLPTNWYCELGNTDADTLILAYGDSHARSMIPALDKYGEDTNTRIIFASIGSCLQLLGITSNASQYPRACSAMSRRVIELAKKKMPAAVVLISTWKSYMRPGGLELTPIPKGLIIAPAADVDMTASTEDVMATGLNNTLSYYHALAIPVLLLKDNPHQAGSIPKAVIRFDPDPNDAKLNREAISLAHYKHKQSAANDLLESAASPYSNAHIFNTAKALCDADTCPWARGGRLLYYDSTHLSVAGAMEVYPLLANSLNQIIDMDVQSN